MIQPGEFWVADIPFTDASASKRRPVLVLWLDAADAVVAAVTSAPPRSVTDVALADWKTSGLRLQSTVRLSRLDCLEQTLLISPARGDIGRGRFRTQEGMASICEASVLITRPRARRCSSSGENGGEEWIFNVDGGHKQIVYNIPPPDKSRDQSEGGDSQADSDKK